MNSTPENTTLMTLPTRFQLDIIKLLNWEDRKNVRLTCTELFYLVNSFGKPGCYDVSDWSLDQLLKSTFTLIETLRFSNVTKALPIFSSTRILIPKTTRLIIGPGISSENVLKIIRYYAKYCTELRLQTSLPFLKSMNMFGNSTCLANIKVFDIVIVMRQPFIYQQQYLAGLGQFFEWVNMPSLNFVRVYMTRVLGNHGNFHKSFANFLMKHGPLLKSVHFRIPGILWLGILNSLEFLVNVHDLFVRDKQDIGKGNIDSIKNGFRNFNKLRLLDIDVDSRVQNELYGYLLRNNNATIESMISDSHLSLTWLHTSPKNSNLKYLRLEILYHDPNMFNLAHELKFTLDNLIQLTIQIHDFGGLDWRETFTKWIIQVMPNLNVLNLYYRSQFGVQPRICDIVSIILGLPLLITIKFGDIMYYDQPKIISDEVENWFNQNPQTNTTWIEGEEDEGKMPAYQINIKRPFIHQLDI